jgi:phosphatidate cytidylyltransferase
MAGLGLIVALAAVSGDLWESALKRGAGVKDSGHILPGHGGILDRVDAVLFGVPVGYYLWRWLM